jgi:hypothetical protein
VEKKFSRVEGPPPAAFPDPTHAETAMAKQIRTSGNPSTPGGSYAGG